MGVYNMFDFTAIDFETATNKMSSACSIGLVAVNNLEIVKKEYFLIKPSTNYVSQENTNIHGLTYEDVKDALSFDKVWPIISPYFYNSSFIFAHNAHFDMSVLHECLKEYDIEKPSFQYIDSINFSSKACSGCGNSLLDRCAFFNIDTDNHHNALSDALMCAKLVIASVQSSRYKNFFTYIKVFSSIKVRNFQDLKPRKYIRNQSAFEKIKLSELSPETIVFDTKNPFYQKNCVFTGELNSLNRKDAMQKILDSGGNIRNSVSKSTDYLIVGTQDTIIVGADGLSTKQKKANELIQQGIEIQILTEETFLSLISECKSDNKDIEELFDDTSKEKYISLLKNAIKEQLCCPPEQLVRSLIKDIYNGPTLPAVIDRFRELIIISANNYISNIQNEEIQSNGTPENKKEIIETENDTNFSDKEIKTINFLITLIGTDKIYYTKTKYYVYLHLLDFPNKWICRIYLEQEPKLFILHKFDSTNYETEYLFDNPEQLEQIKNLIVDTYQKCKNM